MWVNRWPLTLWPRCSLRNYDGHKWKIRTGGNQGPRERAVIQIHCAGKERKFWLYLNISNISSRDEKYSRRTYSVPRISLWPPSPRCLQSPFHCCPSYHLQSDQMTINLNSSYQLTIWSDEMIVNVDLRQSSFYPVAPSQVLLIKICLLAAPHCIIKIGTDSLVNASLAVFDTIFAVDMIMCRWLLRSSVVNLPDGVVGIGGVVVLVVVVFVVVVVFIEELLSDKADL